MARSIALLSIQSIVCCCGIRVILCRHGQTEWNVRGLLQGSSDSPLTTQGIDGAVAVGQRLWRQKIAAIYSSPLPRARRTAELILSQLSEPPLLLEDSRLRERAFGNWEGKTWSAVTSTYGAELERSNRDPDYAISGGGESRKETLERALQFLEHLVSTHRADDCVLVVTHSATAACLIKEVLGLRQDQRRSFEVRNCALNVLRHNADTNEWSLSCLGDCAHLGSEGSVLR